MIFRPDKKEAQTFLYTGMEDMEGKRLYVNDTAYLVDNDLCGTVQCIEGEGFLFIMETVVIDIAIPLENVNGRILLLGSE